MLLGAHQSIQGGFFRSLRRAYHDSCEALQIFTKAPAQWKAAPLKQEDVDQFRKTRQQFGHLPVLVHDSYLINPCSDNPDLRQRSWAGLREEAQRCCDLGVEFLVLHPGSAGRIPEKDAISLIANCVDWVLQETQALTILLENTAGQGTSLGHHFEQLAEIIALINHDQNVGVCFDTCHAFAAGYPLQTAVQAEQTFAQFDAVIGLERLMAFHLNDSKREKGSRVDRHARIGQGQIGLELFCHLANQDRFRFLPGILETPVPKGATYRQEVELLRTLRKVRKYHRPKMT